MQLHNLITRVERASTKNHAIDGDVVELLQLQPQGFKRSGGSQPGLFRDMVGTAKVQTWMAPRLTESMDDAARVIDPSWRIRSLSDATETTRARCILEKPDSAQQVGLGNGTVMQTVVGYGCNRAMVMLAAGLRAKATDRGTPVPPSEEFAQNSEQTVREEPALNPREREKLRIVA